MSNDSSQKQHEIIVNLKPVKWAADTISFEQVVQIAYPGPTPPQRIYTVTWKHGHEQGSLVAGQSTNVKSGEAFGVTFTDRS